MHVNTSIFNHKNNNILNFKQFIPGDIVWSHQFSTLFAFIHVQDGIMNLAVWYYCYASCMISYIDRSCSSANDLGVKCTAEQSHKMTCVRGCKGFSCCTVILTAILWRYSVLNIIIPSFESKFRFQSRKLIWCRQSHVIMKCIHMKRWAKKDTFMYT